jgi:hypothetical protein
MNKKYQKYIDYIAKDLEAPYFKNMRDSYGLKQDEMKLVLSKVYNQPVTIKGNRVFDSNGNEIYYENSTGYWFKREYDDNDNLLYWEDSYGDIRDKR